MIAIRCIHIATYIFYFVFPKSSSLGKGNKRVSYREVIWTYPIIPLDHWFFLNTMMYLLQIKFSKFRFKKKLQSWSIWVLRMFNLQRKAIESWKIIIKRQFYYFVIFLIAIFCYSFSDLIANIKEMRKSLSWTFSIISLFLNIVGSSNNQQANN